MLSISYATSFSPITITAPLAFNSLNKILPWGSYKTSSVSDSLRSFQTHFTVLRIKYQIIYWVLISFCRFTGPPKVQRLERYVYAKHCTLLISNMDRGKNIIIHIILTQNVPNFYHNMWIMCSYVNMIINCFKFLCYLRHQKYFFCRYYDFSVVFNPLYNL